MRKRTLLSLALSMTVLAGGAPVHATTVAQPAAPLQLTLLSPVPGVVTNDTTVTLAGTTTAESVVMVANDETPTALLAGAGAFSAQVVLRDGLNHIRVVAHFGKTELSQERIVRLDRQPARISSFVARRARFCTSSASRRRIASYRVSERARLVAMLTTRTGKRLRVLNRSAKRPGRQTIVWNGRLRRGRLIRSGIYRLTLTAVDAAGNTTVRSRRLRISVQNDSRPQRIARVALRLRGVRYVWGGMSRRGVDCSGLVGLAYRRNGVRLPRTSRAMARIGRRVARGRLRPADILLFNTGGGGISHAGLYLGRGQFIHASSGRGRVVISSLRGRSYYRGRLVTARRVLR